MLTKYQVGSAFCWAFGIVVFLHFEVLSDNVSAICASSKKVHEIRFVA